MSTDITLPKELDPFRHQLFQAARSYIELLPRERRRTLPWASRVGGMPYWPASMEYPTAPDGKPLWLLAQVNFAEMPALPSFPEHGLLQFFLNDDSMYGLSLSDPFSQSRFRTVYHPFVQEEHRALLDDFSFLGQANFLPIEGGVPYPLEFRLREELAPPTDYQFDQLMGEGFFERFGAEEWEIRGQYTRAVLSSQHKMGGYAFFCQSDPRHPEEPMELLFQLGSSDQFNCMWGDMGVANFFIRREDLLRADFSRVMYNWDCY